MTRGRGDHPAKGLVALVVILAILYIHAVYLDKADAAIVRSIASPDRYVGIISDGDRYKIEQVIRDYIRREELNTSLTKSMTRDVLIGCGRGTLFGIALTGNPIPAAVSFGTLSGIMTWGSRHIPPMKYIL
jgi:hypothetical protein